MLDRKKAPNISDAVHFSYHLPKCNKKIMKNNIPLYWISSGTQDVIQVSWVFEAGLWQESQNGMAQAAAALLKSGTKNKTAAEIDEAIEFYGASFTVRTTNDHVFVNLFTLSKYLDVLLPLIQEIIFEVIFPESEFKIYIKNTSQHIRVKMQNTDFVANRKIDEYLFGKGHPYGKSVSVTDLEALDLNLLKDFYRKFYTSENCTIFMAGRVMDSDVNLIEQYFGKENWTSDETKEEIKHNLFAVPVKNHRLNISDQEMQGSIRIARPFVSRTHPDFSKFALLNTVFGGYFDSRLMNNIREDKGYTYGIYSQIYSFKKESSFMIATEAGQKVCEAAVEEIYKEMDILKRELISEEELLLVKNYLLGNILSSLDGPFSVIRRWQNIILNDLPEDNFETNIQIYKETTSAELMNLAQKYFDKSSFYELIVT